MIARVLYSALRLSLCSGMETPDMVSNVSRLAATRHTRLIRLGFSRRNDHGPKKSRGEFSGFRQSRRDPVASCILHLKKVMVAEPRPATEIRVGHFASHIRRTVYHYRDGLRNVHSVPEPRGVNAEEAIETSTTLRGHVSGPGRPRSLRFSPGWAHYGCLWWLLSEGRSPSRFRSLDFRRQTVPTFASTFTNVNIDKAPAATVLLTG